MELLANILLYRFRVRTEAGTEHLSPIASTRVSAEGEDAAAGPGEDPLAPTDPSQPEPMLANLRWSGDSFEHADHATMMVDARNAEGRTIRFEVEHLHGEEWTHYDTVEAEVHDGRAEAILQMHHPAPGEPQASASDLRFRCEVVATEPRKGVQSQEITLYRFKVRTKGGREALSRLFATRQPPIAHLAGHRDAERIAKGEPDKPEMLANARWSDGSFAHGDHAAMLVDAPGLDGRKIIFHVQHRAEEDWTDYDDVEAEVQGGVAQAELPLHHPAPGEAEASAADLRFACELI